MSCVRHRPGLTFAELKQEVLSALDQEGNKKQNESRDKALEELLLTTADVEIPETLITEQSRTKFAIMMTDVSARCRTACDDTRFSCAPMNLSTPSLTVSM